MSAARIRKQGHKYVDYICGGGDRSFSVCEGYSVGALGLSGQPGREKFVKKQKVIKNPAVCFGTLRDTK